MSDYFFLLWQLKNFKKKKIILLNVNFEVIYNLSKVSHIDNICL